MIVKLNKTDLIRLVKSALPNMDRCIELDRRGFMEYTGNQYNIEWKWKSEFLRELKEDELWKLYCEYR